MSSSTIQKLAWQLLLNLARRVPVVLGDVYVYHLPSGVRRHGLRRCAAARAVKVVVGCSVVSMCVVVAIDMASA